MAASIVVDWFCGAEGLTAVFTVDLKERLAGNEKKEYSSLIILSNILFDLFDR
jgi:hypothetical protein